MKPFGRFFHFGREGLGETESENIGYGYAL